MDWQAERQKHIAFMETELGKAFHKFEQATIRYWQVDNSETISDRRLTELDNAMKEARKQFLALIMKD